jgi:hypothetical protein
VAHITVPVVTPSFPQLAMVPVANPTQIVVPVGTPPPVTSIVSSGGVIAPHPTLPTPAGSSTPAPVPVETANPVALAPTGSRGSQPPGGDGGGGAGPTALLGVVLAAGFIGAVELRERRRPVPTSQR